MNTSSGKFASWLVCVRDPQVQPVRFNARGQWIDGHRFSCVLTSADEKEYMFGAVPFDFKNRHAAQQAAEKFTDMSVWQISKPNFDGRSKAEFISAPLKSVLLMRGPTEMTKIDEAGDCEAKKKAWPSGQVFVPLTLCATLSALKKVRLTHAFGSDKEPSKSLDVCGKLVSLSELKSRKKKDGSEIFVADLTLADDSNVAFSLAVWEEAAYVKLSGITVGTGITLISCKAQKDVNTGDYKINVWPTVHVILGGARADAMTNMTDSEAANCANVTAAFVSSPANIDIAGMGAVPTSATALASIPEDASDFPEQTVFQLNRVVVTAPITEDQITTKKGDRLWVQATVHDWTGAATIHVQDKAVPQLYGCCSSEEVFERAKEGTLRVETCRLNMRGIIRREADTVKKIVAEVGISPLCFKISSAAMRATKGIASIGTGAAQVAPVEKIQCDAMQGLCVVSSGTVDDPDLVPCQQIYILVTGTEESDLEPMDDSVTDMKQQTYCVCSRNAKCMLSVEKEVRINLKCYCTYRGMLKYRLDKDSALVSITNLQEKDGNLEAAVEHMEKVSSQELADVKASMDMEWKTALTNIGTSNLDKFESPVKAGFWRDPPRKVARLNSDPKTPQRL